MPNEKTLVLVYNLFMQYKNNPLSNAPKWAMIVCGKVEEIEIIEKYIVKNKVFLR